MPAWLRHASELRRTIDIDAIHGDVIATRQPQARPDAMADFERRAVAGGRSQRTMARPRAAPVPVVPGTGRSVPGHARSS